MAIIKYRYRNAILHIAVLFLSLDRIAEVQGRQEIWSEQFTGPAGTLPSGSNWRFDLGTGYPGGPNTWGTGEVQIYTNNTENISLDGNGNLKITPLRDNTGKWTSARIETQRDDFKPPAGGVLVFEGRIQMPDITGDSALGYWPAFWALGNPYRGNYNNWPGIGEYDFMENVNGINKVWGTLHCGVGAGGPCKEKDGLGNNVPCPGASCQSAFHTYKFEWDDGKKEFRWFVDDQQFHKVTKDQIGEGTWNDITNHGYFILLNVAMGGGFPDGVANQKTPTPATVPGHPMIVDYVSVYTL